MSDIVGIKRSQDLSKYVKEYALYKHTQQRRVMPRAKPTRVPENVAHSEFVDTRVLEYGKVAALLRTVGIFPLIGETIASPIQRVHISSEIGRLNSLHVRGIPHVSSIEDLATLSSSEARRLRHAAGNDRETAAEEEKVRLQAVVESERARGVAAATIQQATRARTDRARTHAAAPAIRAIARRDLALHQLRGFAEGIGRSNRERAATTAGATLGQGIQGGQSSAFQRTTGSAAVAIYAEPKQLRRSERVAKPTK
jgi:hypothetical protein